MNRKHFVWAVTAVFGLALLSCQRNEIDFETCPDDTVFHACIEQPAAESRVYADAQLRVLWHAGDRVSIFNKYTFNHQYAFQGATGDDNGEFKKVPCDDFVTGNKLDYVYAVYPYLESTSIGNDGVMTVTLPSRQSYAEGSFGRGDNLMCAVSGDDNLMFRNVCGYLAFKLYGDGVSVTGISFQGNNGEILSGKATLTASLSGVPVIMNVVGDADTRLKLTCSTPVALGATSGEYKEFWLVIPPMTFKQGFTLTVTDNKGGVFKKSTSKPVTISRNHLSRMSPVEVVPGAPEGYPEAVDLGLSVMWASWNLGATAPEECGDYFAWGETEPKSEYNWYNYKWNGGGWMTKYSLDVDGKVILDEEDDAAHAALGGDWWIPSVEQAQELYEQCSWRETERNGKYGYLVTGPNGNSIFLPYSGWYEEWGLADKFALLLWLNQCDDWSGRMLFLDGYDDGVDMTTDRYKGLCIRPVNSGPRVAVTGVRMSQESVALMEGQTATLMAMVTPANASNRRIIWSSSDGAVATVDNNGLVWAAGVGTATITATTADGGYTATCAVTVTKYTVAEPEMVDLGLSVLWASCNIGASAPEEYGDRYAWGETLPKSYYDWDNYKWCNGKWQSMIKYCTDSIYEDTDAFSGAIDGKEILDEEDDAAHAVLGGNWWIPTVEQGRELFEKCSWQEMAQNGVNGYLVTGPNGNSIFLPCAGMYWESGLVSVGSAVTMWLNQCDGSYRGWTLQQNGIFVQYHRHDGLCIRPVYGERLAVSGVTISQASVSMTEGSVITLTATVTPENAVKKRVNWSSSNKSVATVSRDGQVHGIAPGSATISAETEDGGFAATCAVTVTAYTVAEPEEVDLGLSVKWASFNLGATAPEGFGCFYAWGETAPKTDYSWEKYQFYSSSLTKYNTAASNGTVDDKWYLDPEDDAAHAALGGTWRMPTDAEWTELFENCASETTYLKGIKGLKMTSKMAGYADKWIFLPVAGEMNGTNFYPPDDYTYPVYWSSSLVRDNPNAAWLIRPDGLSQASRELGFPVRPVSGGLDVTAISLSKEQLFVYEGRQQALVANVLPTIATNKAILWSSDNTSVATVGSDGVVSGVSQGTAHITATTVDGGLTASCEVSVIPASKIMIDGDFSDWEALNSPFVAQATCAPDAPKTALQKVKVYADASAIYVYFEWDKEQISYVPYEDHVPFHIYLNADGDTATGGYADEFSDACMDVVFEGFLTDGVSFISYDPGIMPWAGEANGYGWDWNWDDWFEMGSGICSGAGIEGKYELQIYRDRYPFGQIADTFSIGFDIQQYWDSVGILPNANVSDKSPDGRAPSLWVTTNK